jgi:hypothetical protein
LKTLSVFWEAATLAITPYGAGGGVLKVHAAKRIDSSRMKISFQVTPEFVLE